MSDYYNAFWSSQDTPAYTLTTETKVMIFAVLDPGQAAVPPTAAHNTLSFTSNPGDATMGPTNYVGNAGMNTFNNDPNAPGDSAYTSGPFFADSATRITEITDGTSNTLAFGEALGGSETGSPTLAFTWMATGVLPTYWDCQTPSMWFTFGSNHPNVVNFAFCDGSVRGLNKVAITDKEYVVGNGASPNPPPEPPAAINTPHWTAFQLLGGMNDNKTPDWSQLGSGAAGN